MRKSKIFSNSELEELDRRKNKDYSDKSGLFSGRVRPKIIELLEEWFPQKKQLQKYIIPKKVHKEDKR